MSSLLPPWGRADKNENLKAEVARREQNRKDKIVDNEEKMKNKIFWRNTIFMIVVLVALIIFFASDCDIYRITKAVKSFFDLAYFFVRN